MNDRKLAKVTLDIFDSLWSGGKADVVLSLALF